MKESSQDSRILRRTWEEQMTRDRLALVLREERWMRNKKLDLEILSISQALEGWKDLTLYDLKFLDSLSCSDLSKIWIYKDHWMRQISSHGSMTWKMDGHSYYPKYVFLYEIFKDSSLIDEEIKVELKEKAESEIWEMIFDEIKNGTFLCGWSPSILEHIFEYVTQKEVVSKLWWIWNVKRKAHEDSLWKYADWLTEMDEEYECTDNLEEQKDVKKYYDEEDYEEKEREIWEIFENLHLPIRQ